MTTHGKQTLIPDGLYVLQRHGSMWITVRSHGERLWQAEASHLAAGHDWAGVPSDDDERVNGDLAAAVVRAVLGHTADPARVVVTKRR